MEPLVLANHHRCLYESALWVRLIASKKALDSGRSPEGGWGVGNERGRQWVKGQRPAQGNFYCNSIQTNGKGKELSHTHTQRVWYVRNSLSYLNLENNQWY